MRKTVSRASSFGAAWIGACAVALACGCSSGSSGNGPAAGDDAGADADAATDAGTDASFSPAWACLGHVVLPQPTKPTLSAQFQLLDEATATAADASAYAPVAGASVQLCGPMDPTCGSPLSLATSDAMGLVTFGYAPGFTGFFTAQALGDVENLQFTNVPIEDDAQPYPTAQWSRAELMALYGSGGVAWDTTKAAVQVQLFDCYSVWLNPDSVVPPPGVELAAGVSVTTDATAPGITVAYVAGGAVSTSATQTDASGRVAIVNVPEGWVTLTATLAATGQKVGTARVYAKAGAVTSLAFSPSP